MAPTTTTTNPADDLRMRMVTSDEQMAEALAALEGNDSFEFALVPLAYPNKDRGFWTLGQEVIQPAGAFVLCNNDDSYREARQTVCAFAASLMEQGMTGYAVVRRDGSAAMFEDMSADFFKGAK